MPIKVKYSAAPHIFELGKVDNKRRITLPKVRLATYYEMEVTDAEEIILRPRTLVDPREVISKKTLQVLNESMASFQEGRVGDPIDLSSFEEPHEKAKVSKKPTRP